MIKASFSIHGDSAAFQITGHAEYAEPGQDIVCAAVSSAAYFAANTVTEILRVPAEVEEKAGSMRLAFSDSAAAADIVRGLLLHLENLEAQYPAFISVKREV
ncbi:MAG: ribosomal-processing cysteine protease Prp [Clostridia bacterium]|nr:ribosomal-processing cysteine protease Prp [Clostridia bacterium]MBR0537731.1 ribosomal-processing cysteine protease Prp [Clostridia bacterium]